MKDGFSGVVKSGDRWAAYIAFRGAWELIGHYKTKQEAEKARADVEGVHKILFANEENIK